MRRIIASLFLIIGFTGAASAAYESPKALVEAIYQPYQHGGEHTDLTAFYSERLKGIIADNLALQESTDPVGVPVSPATPDLLHFNPFIGGENALLLDVVIGEPVVSGDRADRQRQLPQFRPCGAAQPRAGARGRRLGGR